MPEGKKTAAPAPAQDSYTAKTHLQHQVREIGTVAATAAPAEEADYMVPSEARPEIITYDKLTEAIRASGRAYNTDMIEKAYRMANDAHKDARRRSGEPYICHPLAVARLVLDLGMDTESIAAALLHDVVEDTPITIDEVKSAFGAEVALLVDGVTKLTKIQFSSIEEQQAENLRKMLLAMSQDVRVMIIKLCDRLHNMRTGDAWPEQKRRDKARETMEVYAPIANRLGILNIKEELEDRSLHYLDPVGYEEISKLLSERSGEEFLAGVSALIEKRLEESGIHGAAMKRRVKSIYGIYRKMFVQNKAFDEIYDVYAVRIILDTITECYSALGLIHDMYHPLPNRFKDYISTPKPNGYQSLHTTVIGHEGIPFEVQIRTRQMDEQAEYGVAAHWKYKQGIKGEGGEKTYEWIRRLLENQEDADAEDFIHSLKIDMFSDEVFVFTPRGDVINLPAESTPIDFAYSIHSAIGNSMVGAKVNGRMVGFDYQLHNGDIVEINTSKSAHGPSRDWVKIARSSEARSKIRQWFKKERREENIAQGRASFESELKHAGMTMAQITAPDVLPAVMKRIPFKTLDEMYAAIGYGGYTALKAVNRIRDEIIHINRTAGQEKAAEAAKAQPPAKEQPENAKGLPKKVKSEKGIVVEGLSNCLVKFSKCCTPVPGDEIVGFITRGYGVSVHRKDCPNADPARRSEADQGRWIKVSWGEDVNASYDTSLEVVCKDRPKLLMDISTVLSTSKVNVSGLNVQSTADGFAIFHVTISVTGYQQLDQVMRKLGQISSVMKVTRPAG